MFSILKFNGYNEYQHPWNDVVAREYKPISGLKLLPSWLSTLSSLSWEKSIAFVVLLTWYIYLCVAEFTSFCLPFNDLILFCAENLIISQPLEEILCAQSCGSSSTYLHSTQRDGCKTMLLIYWYYTNEMLSKLWIMTIQHYL